MKRQLRDFIDRLSGRKQTLVLTIAASIIFGAGVVGYLTSSSNDRVKLDEPDQTTSSTTPFRKGIPGFDEVAFTVVNDDESKKFCAALAQTPEQQAAGMKSQTDFGGYDAMIFPFAADSTAEFYMAGVRFALSVAFFDADGQFISAADMPVCTTQDGNCPRYKAQRAYRMAMETVKGGLSQLDIGSDTKVTFGGPCS